MTNIQELVTIHDEWRNETIDLIPSENALSPAVRQLLGSDLASRYTLPLNAEVHGIFIENAYRGTAIADRVVERTTSLACEVFGAAHSLVEPIAGHIAAMMVVLSLTKKGDLIMAIPSSDGGYDGYGGGYIPDILSLGYEPLPFDRDRYGVDTRQAVEAILEKRPRLVVLGASYIPFPYELEPLARACREAGSYLVYDASHVMGLLAGGQFQPDALEHCDAVFGSTHKSFFGPQGGIILTNDAKLMESFRSNTTWRLMDNPHLNRIAALGQALEEMNLHGNNYARAVISNAQALATSLHERGFPVLLGPEHTASHQVLYDTDTVQELYSMSCNELSRSFERQGIITDSVGRFGTAEVTRMGLDPSGMEELASLIVGCASGEDIHKGVRILRSRMHMSFL